MSISDVLPLYPASEVDSPTSFQLKTVFSSIKYINTDSKPLRLSVVCSHTCVLLLQKWEKHVNDIWLNVKIFLRLKLKYTRFFQLTFDTQKASIQTCAACNLHTNQEQHKDNSCSGPVVPRLTSRGHCCLQSGPGSSLSCLLACSSQTPTPLKRDASSRNYILIKKNNLINPGNVFGNSAILT